MPLFFSPDAAGWAPDALTLGIAAVIFVASLVRTTFGFGDALVGMPILALFVEFRTAAPVMAFCAIVVSLLLIVPYWRSIQFSGLWPLAISAVLGIPIGAIFLRQVDPPVMKTVLAVIVLGYAAFRLSQPDRWTLKSDRAAWGFGFASGILGGAFNTGGPPVVIYGSLRRWSPGAFRSTMQGLAFPIGGCILLGHYLAGLWARPVFVHFGWSVPGIVVGVLIGNILHHRLRPERFDRIILALLLAVGLLLLSQSVWHLLK